MGGGAEPAHEPDSGLARALGLPALFAYGVGGMLGGGIYALVGKIAGVAGDRAFLAFLIAMAVAAPTALSYAELSARHPRSGSEAAWCRRAFRGEALPFVVGWMVLCSCIVSMSALTVAFAGYVTDLAPAAPAWAVVLAFLGGLAALNLRGIRFASAANVACTIVEASGLAAVIAAGAYALYGGDAEPARAATAATAATAPTAIGPLAVLHAAGLAFYAFIGFEDMANVAEEVREPRRAYPIAVPAALGVVGLTYALVAFVATRVVAPSELAATGAPLTRVVAAGAPWVPPWAFTLVALFAVANTALLNFVTSSRLAYGMARDGLLPAALAGLHAEWRTPRVAILAILAVALPLALAGRLAWLAGSTSFLLLCVFATIDVALVRLHRDPESARARALGLPRALPAVGACLCVAMTPFLPPASIATGAALALCGLLVHAIRRRAVQPLHGARRGRPDA